MIITGIEFEADDIYEEGDIMHLDLDTDQLEDDDLIEVLEQRGYTVTGDKTNTIIDQDLIDRFLDNFDYIDNKDIEKFLTKHNV